MKRIQKFSLSQQMLLFTLILTAIRIFKFDNLGPLFLVWNLFLAWIPVFIINQLEIFPSKKWKYSIIGMCILFLPNSIYIFTDLFHLKQNLHAPLWFDTVLILSFSFLGLYYFSQALSKIKQFFYEEFLNENKVNLIQTGIIFLCSFGVYLGRYLRLNSWNLFTRPYRIVFKFNEAVQEGKLSEIIEITALFGIMIIFLHGIIERKIQVTN